jgi:hypothetical protein
VPRRLLVIANETLESPQVLEELRYWADGDGAEIEVVVPMQRRGALSRFTGGDDSAARERAQGRLDRMLAALTSAGFKPSGRLGDEDPLLALADASREISPDAVVISTHPAGRSRWLQTELVARARRQIDVPVHHIIIDVHHGHQVARTDPRANRAPTETLALFHVADYEKALEIRRTGFRDQANPGESEPAGVWVTDRPGGRVRDERIVFRVELPRETAERFERSPGLADERRFLVPAGILNDAGPITDIGDDSVE